MLSFRDIYDLNETKRFILVNQRIQFSNDFKTDVAMATITFQYGCQV